MAFLPAGRRVAFFAWPLLILYLLVIFGCWSGGEWLVTRSGGVGQGDFTSFWAASKVALYQRPHLVYDWSVLRDAMAEGMGHGFNYRLPFFYPPMFALFLLPLGVFSFPVALVVWLAGGLACYGFAAQRCCRQNGALLALAAPATLWAVLVGQTGLFLGVFFALGLANLARRPWWAGWWLGLLVIKPQYALLVPVALIAGHHWRACLGAATSALLLTVASLAWMGWAALPSWIGALRDAQDILLHQGGLPWFKLQTAYGIFRYAGLEQDIAMRLHLALGVLLTGAIAWLWRSDADEKLKYAALPIAALALVPYCCVYDFAILTIGTLFLIQARDARRVDFFIALMAMSWILAVPIMGWPSGGLAVLALVGTVFALATWRKETNPGTSPG